jgi:hypothetical protein
LKVEFLKGETKITLTLGSKIILEIRLKVRR